MTVERETVFYCRECHQRIIPGESFVRFKVPGKESYQFFHCRFRFGDCWEIQLKQRK